MAKIGIRKRVCWLPSLDSNQGCVIQSHECYHYTTRQCGRPLRLYYSRFCRQEKGVIKWRTQLAHSSSGLGHRPLKAEITGSNPVCAISLRHGIHRALDVAFGG